MYAVGCLLGGVTATVFRARVRQATERTGAGSGTLAGTPDKEQLDLARCDDGRWRERVKPEGMI